MLLDLGQKLADALQRVSAASEIDEALVSELITNVSSALESADVDHAVVARMEKKLKKTLNREDLASAANKTGYVASIVGTELVEILRPQKTAPQPVRNKCNVHMFVGLQGAGKTTTIMKMASLYKRRGFRVGVVAADTFRAGAVDQLLQNAKNVNVPCWGDKALDDPVVAAERGVEHFRSHGLDLILVDTSGRHSQSSELFSEMREIRDAVTPDHVVFVLDATIGQTAAVHAAAFNEFCGGIGSCVLTKTDSGARGGGALSAVAATGAPISFIGTGEKHHDLEPFEVEGFVSRLLGQGDLRGLVQRMEDAGIDQETQIETAKKLIEGSWTLRDFRGQMDQMRKMGSVESILDSLPGIGQSLKAAMEDEDPTVALARFARIMDSMTDEELDSVPNDAEWMPREVEVAAHGRPGDQKRTVWVGRAVRVARGAGVPVTEVQDLLAQYKQMRSLFRGLKKPNSNMMAQAQSMARQMGIDPRSGDMKGNMEKLMGALGNSGMGDMSSLLGALK